MESITPVKVYTVNSGKTWGKTVQVKYFDILVNGDKISEVLAVPLHLKELALGFLVSNAYVEDPETIEKISVEDGEIVVEAAPDFEFRLRYLREKGGSPLEHVEIPPVNTPFSVTSDKIVEKVSMALNQAGILPYGFISDVNGYFFFSEDVKQENNFYKVVGKAIMDHFDLRDSFVFLSEPITPEDIVRSAYLGIPVIGTAKIPTSLAVSVAEALGITLFSIDLEGLKVYTYPSRIQ